MPDVMSGFLIVFIIVLVFMLLLMAIVRFISDPLPGEPPEAILKWMPPALRGEALKNWAATVAEQSTQKCLVGNRGGEMGPRLAMQVEELAMEAMLPMAGMADLERVVACPETGQGLVGLTAPEVLAIARYIRTHKSRAEQNRIRDLAAENAQLIASRPCDDNGQAPLPCALQGQNHVCCVYSARPLHCRPLHALSVANDMGRRHPAPLDSADGASDANPHAQTVAQGVGMGMTRALASAGLDANLYELHSALVTALENPGTEEQWARREIVFHSPLPTPAWRSAASDQFALVL